MPPVAPAGVLDSAGSSDAASGSSDGGSDSEGGEDEEGLDLLGDEFPSGDMDAMSSGEEDEGDEGEDEEGEEVSLARAFCLMSGMQVCDQGRDEVGWASWCMYTERVRFARENYLDLACISICAAMHTCACINKGRCR